MVAMLPPGSDGTLTTRRRGWAARPGGTMAALPQGPGAEDGQESADPEGNEFCVLTVPADEAGQVT
jgi:hypothetical protein